MAFGYVRFTSLIVAAVVILPLAFPKVPTREFAGDLSADAAAARAGATAGCG